MPEPANNGTPVTRSELAQAIVSIDAKLERIPSRWEMRFTILAGLVGAQMLPVSDIAQAALSALPH
jgi:hypothetical protein